MGHRRCYGEHKSPAVKAVRSAAPGGDLNGVDPPLGPLADNGGPLIGAEPVPLLTHALMPNSPAIDAGDNVDCPATDERGFKRPADGNCDGMAVCDIGAYEFWLSVFLPQVVR